MRRLTTESCKPIYVGVCVLLSMIICSTPQAGEIVFTEGIEYSNPDNQHLELNLAIPKEVEGLRPAILCVHGGGFRAGQRDRWNGLVTELAEQGYVAITITYRLSPAYQFSAHVNDAKAGIRWLRANAKKYKVDPDRIGVVGDSAGGHIALFLGMTNDVRRFDTEGGNIKQSSRVSCVVSYYGPSDLTRSYEASVNAAEVLPLFLGGDLSTHRQRHIIASPLYWVTPNAVPTLMLQGSEDPYVHPDQTDYIHTRLQSVGVESKLILFEGAGHGFRGEDTVEAKNAMMAFFDKHLKNQGMAPGR